MARGDLPDDWGMAGLWHDGKYTEYSSRVTATDHAIDTADAIVVYYHDQTWNIGEVEYVTIHGADGWHSLYNLVYDIDEDSYFG